MRARALGAGALAALACALPGALAACGGDDDGGSAPPATSRDAVPPTATTGEPPGARRGPPPGETAPGATPRAGARYACDGEPLRAIRPRGPVRVDPPVVRPGERFGVVVTDERAGVALVSLAGVSDVPISAQARRAGGALRATLRMPQDASCGNKLLTVEGDVRAEAYVGVAD